MILQIIPQFPKTRLQKEMERLQGAVEVAGELDQAPKEATTSQETPTPGPVLGAFLSGAKPRVAQVQPEGIMAAFLRGAAEEATRPLTVFGLDVELDAGFQGGLFERPERPVSRVLGQVAGLLAGFVPLGIGARATTRAFGLGAALTEAEASLATIAARQLVPGGQALLKAQQTVRGLTVKKAAIEGGLAFGLFEAGSSEEVSQVPLRFLGGAAFGVAADALLAGRLAKKSISKITEQSSARSKGLTSIVEQALSKTGPQRVSPEFVTPFGTIVQSGFIGPVGARAVEYGARGFDLVPKDYAFSLSEGVAKKLGVETAIEGVQPAGRAARHSLVPVTDATVGAGDAFLYSGEGTLTSGERFLDRTSVFAPRDPAAPIIGARVSGETIIQSEVSVPSNLVTTRPFGEHQLANDFAFPVTRAVGKPLEYNPVAGTAKIKLTTPERVAVVDALEGQGIGSELFPQLINDVDEAFALTLAEGKIIRNHIVSAFPTKFRDVERAAELNLPEEVRASIKSFQDLQLAASKFDVFGPSAEVMVGDLAAIDVTAKSRALIKTGVVKGEVVEVFVDADAEALEMAISGFGKDSLDDSVLKLALAGRNINEQLETTVAKMGMVLNGGGASFYTTSPEGAARTTREVLAQFPKAKVGNFRFAPGESWLWISGERVDGFVAMETEITSKVQRVLVDRAEKFGLNSEKDFDDFFAILAADFERELIPPPIFTAENLASGTVRGATGQEFATIGEVTIPQVGNVLEAVGRPGRSVLFTDANSPAKNRVVAMIHEYWHTLWAGSKIQKRQGPRLLGDSFIEAGGFEELFPELNTRLSKVEWDAIFGTAPTTVWKDMSQMQKLTILAEGHPGVGKTTLATIRKQGLRNIAGEEGKFFQPNEMWARAGETILIDPIRARQLAPDVYRELLGYIAENSPKLAKIIGNKRLARVGEVVNEKAWSEIANLRQTRQSFGQIRMHMTDPEIAIFNTTGVIKDHPIQLQIGDRVDVFLMKKRVGDDLIVRERWTETTHRFPWSDVRAVNIVPSRFQSQKVLDDLRALSRNVDRIDVPLGIAGTDQAVVATIKLGDRGLELFENVNVLRRHLSSGAGKVAEREIALMSDTQVFNHAASVILQKGKGFVVESTGARGFAVRHNNGITFIGPEMRQVGLGGRAEIGTVDASRVLPAEAAELGGQVGGQVIHVSERQLVTSMLERGGLNARDIPYITDDIITSSTDDLFRNFTEEAYTVQSLAEATARGFGGESPGKTVAVLKQMNIDATERAVESYFSSTSLRKLANSKGVKVRDSVDGKVSLERTDGQVIGVFDNAGAEEWLRRGGYNRRDLHSVEMDVETDLGLELGDMSKAGQSGFSYDVPPRGPGKPPARPGADHSGFGSGGSGDGPKFGETMFSGAPERPGFLVRFSNAVDLMAPFLTGGEALSKTIQETTSVPAFTKIFKPLQDAVRLIDRLMKQPVEGLGGRSFHDQLKAIQKLTFKVHKRADRENIVTYLEAMSKEEMARAGGLTVRGMNQFELRLSKEIERLGLSHQMPQLLATWKMMRNLTKGRKQFFKRFNTVIKQELPPELKARILTLEKFARSNKEFEFERLTEVLNFTESQTRMIQVIDTMFKSGIGPDEFAWMSVMRHTSAESLPPGFRTMRDVMAKRLNLSEPQLKAAAEMEKLFDETFKVAGLDPQRYIRGYFPHMRVMAREGILPDDAFMRELMPRESAYSAKKFRTGELDIYSKDPLTIAAKHVRGVLMQKHFDPLLKEANAALKELEIVDPRLARIMRAYRNELQGQPHESFRKLQAAIESGSRAMGIEMDRDFAKKLIATLSSLTYQALIPFRMGLIARNYFQMVQTIAPRTGMKDFAAGLRIALTKDGYEAARRAGAVTENIAPVLSSEAQLGLDKTFKIAQRMQRVSEVGFKWYQKADDVGRAAAYHAQRQRTSRAMNKYMSGVYGKDEITAITKMMEEGGVRQFKDVDQQIFSQLFSAGKIDEAIDHLAVTLPRETIFRYGHANHPAGWGAVYGRLFGQFGTWPVQYKDYLIQGFTRGTVKDKTRFITIHAGVNFGVLAAGATAGYDLRNWVTFPALTYTGGPYASIAIDMVKMTSGNKREKALAYRSLKFQFVPTLSDPRAIWLPGSYAVGDLVRGFSGGGGVDQAFGFREYKPGRDAWLDALDFSE